MKNPPALNRVNVTHRKPTDPGVQWLVSCGYRFKMSGRLVYLERVVQAARMVC